ncbi:MAG: HU family DNA-binding protein [Clostridia bacterium]|nr:HU family DNA-binding protein [Clostridia bacterium]MBR3196423.1 HU family DNA-binding protein [Clostridia bacterium]
MKKNELIEAMVKKTGATKAATEKTLNAFVETVIEALKEGDRVQLSGFGTFEVRERAERKGRNPFTGEEMNIAATKSPAFKAGKRFKDAL